MKSLFFTIAFLSIASISFGQLELGPKVGYNYLFVSYSPSASSTETPEVSGQGFHLGAYAQIELSDGFYVGGELLASLRSYNEILGSDNTLDGIRIKNESFTHRSPFYLDIPIFAKYSLNLSGSRYSSDKMLSFYAGPVASLYMGGSGSTQETVRTEALNQTTIVQTDIDFTKTEMKEYFNSFHLGVMAGVQFSLSMGLNFDLRLNRTLMPTNSTVLDEYGKVNNTIIQLSLGYNIFGSQY
ncbi:MAG: hypothetical protein ACJASQ_000582 [Crocinitomicaceae bacterium]|jgi:hypothetical protein